MLSLWLLLSFLVLFLLLFLGLFLLLPRRRFAVDLGLDLDADTDADEEDVGVLRASVCDLRLVLLLPPPTEVETIEMLSSGPSSFSLKSRGEGWEGGGVEVMVAMIVFICLWFSVFGLCSGG